MVCPISAEVSVYTEGDYGRRIYWGDECGQIFAARTRDEGRNWTVRRLINLNDGAKQVSPNHRKIMRRLDLVVTTCSGAPSVGVYFGTGDVQSPASFAQLMLPSVTNGRELVGVVWDDDNLPNWLTQANLYNLDVQVQKSAVEMRADRLPRLAGVLG